VFDWLAAPAITHHPRKSVQIEVVIVRREPTDYPWIVRADRPALDQCAGVLIANRHRARFRAENCPGTRLSRLSDARVEAGIASAGSVQFSPLCGFGSFARDEMLAIALLCSTASIVARRCITASSSTSTNRHVHREPIAAMLIRAALGCPNPGVIFALVFDMATPAQMISREIIEFWQIWACTSRS
jgi:hypothetical protein